MTNGSHPQAKKTAPKPTIAPRKPTAKTGTKAISK